MFRSFCRLTTTTSIRIRLHQRDYMYSVCNLCAESLSIAIGINFNRLCNSRMKTKRTIMKTKPIIEAHVVYVFSIERDYDYRTPWQTVLYSRIKIYLLGHSVYFSTSKIQKKKNKQRMFLVVDLIYRIPKGIFITYKCDCICLSANDQLCCDYVEFLRVFFFLLKCDHLGERWIRFDYACVVCNKWCEMTEIS